MRNQPCLVALYLAAIVGANLITTHFGPSASIIMAFLFIGLDLTTRDSLHDAWHGRGLWWRMFALIAAGSALSYAINHSAQRIAVASLVSFAATGVVDAIIYQILRRRKWMTKVTGSNVISALVDSVLFPTLAFGAFLPLIVLGQFGAKTVGGLLWAVYLKSK